MILVRLAKPAEYPAVGDLTVQAYLADGGLPANDAYYDSADADGRRRTPNCGWRSTPTTNFYTTRGACRADLPQPATDYEGEFTLAALPRRADAGWADPGGAVPELAVADRTRWISTADWMAAAITVPHLQPGGADDWSPRPDIRYGPSAPARASPEQCRLASG